MKAVGYAFVQVTLGISALPLRRPAIVQPVTRLKQIDNTLAVPPAMAPAPDDILGHILFALKHEGINLGILIQALPQIPIQTIENVLRESPNGIYIRKACYLREAFTGEPIRQSTPVRGVFVPLFDPKRYITRAGPRNSRWRIEFNGLGSLAYCATVERTAELEALLNHDILGRARTFIDSLPKVMMDRAINWAYLSETQDSFAIEREAPSADKAHRFIELLQQAHDRRPLSEEYLIALQNATVSNKLDMAAAYRHEQNHLAGALPGAAGVTYVPPPPELCRELMEELIQFANEAPDQVDPLIAAGIISFGFVFLHPFMDGNGRLSRFLIHQTLCRSKALEHGLLLPVSVAMKRDEEHYLETLLAFSKPARDWWSVRWIDYGNLTFDFTGHPSIYRYWDATPAVTFTLEMAQRALEVELQQETIFLKRFDQIVTAVNDNYDVRGSDLANLVMMCLTNDGKMSKNRRKQYQYTVTGEVFDFIEQQAQALLAHQET